MIDRLEIVLERWTHRVQLALILRLHPELLQIKHDHDREWAVWFASEDEPVWRRYLVRFIVFCGGPALATLMVFMLALQYDPRWRMHWMWLFGTGWMFGFAVSALIAVVLRHRRAQRRYFLAMRIFGQDVCPDCGYDMEGHTPVLDQTRRCPECGNDVPLKADRSAG